MRLSEKEFNAMNHPFRKFLQQTIELPYFKKFGLSISGRDVLEIGCGSGFGAQLLMEQNPKSYMGIDLMPEQIALAKQRNLYKCSFQVMDASDLSALKSSNYDIIVIFGILHHIPEWKKALKEIYRLLKPEGWFFIEEPDGDFLKIWDKIFHWGHPEESDFSLKSFEEYTRTLGFVMEKKRNLFLFGFYRFLK